MIERDLFSRIKEVINSPEAIVITGMRRVGKTTLLKRIFDEIKSENKIFLDLENPFNGKYFERNDYDRIFDEFKILGLNPKEKGYIFLDEIQFVKNLPSVVKYLFDRYKIKFFLTSSSSFYLKNIFTESLAGRKYIFELYPLSFKEFLKFRDPKMDLSVIRQPLSGVAFEKINRYFDEYILYGGFPGVVQKESVQEKRMALEDIFSSYFQLEVVQLGDFRKINIIRDLMLLLMQRVGSKLDIQKLSRELGASRETIYNYVSFLENTYFINLIRPFSLNRDIEIRSVPKFYLCDSGLINYFAKVDEGALFENTIFLSLRAGGEVNYYQKKSGVEIDFILNKKYAYEVKTSPRQNDVKKLESLAKDIKLKDFKIISKKYSDLDKVVYGFMI